MFDVWDLYYREMKTMKNGTLFLCSENQEIFNHLLFWVHIYKGISTAQYSLLSMTICLMHSFPVTSQIYPEMYEYPKKLIEFIIIKDDDISKDLCISLKKLNFWAFWSGSNMTSYVVHYHKPLLPRTSTVLW